MSKKSSKYEEILKRFASTTPEIYGAFIIDVNGNMVASDLPSDWYKQASDISISTAVTILSILHLSEYVDLGPIGIAAYIGSEGYVVLYQIDEIRVLVTITNPRIKFGLLVLDIRRIIKQLAEIPYEPPKRKYNLKQKLQEIEDEFRRGLIVFISYATKDAQRFHIPDVARELEAIPEIEEVLYWQEDAHGSIVHYMNRNVPRCNIFILFCSQNALQSGAIQVEWETAHILQKFIIPIFESVDDIPPLLQRLNRIEFKATDFVGTIKNLKQEILDIYTKLM
ncbi:MAG: TIR domain-containing protein [Candidatus Helarchaeota archaeon]